MAQAQRIGPERDRKEVPLPPGLLVGKSPKGKRFHLVSDGLPVCESREVVDGLEELAVEEAREDRGLSACRSCFRVGFSQQRSDNAGKNILIRIGNPSVYHAPGRSSRPECMYSPGRDEATYAKIPRHKAVSAGLDPCTGCFGFDPDQMDKICPLCGKEHSTERLNGHLPDCPEADI